MNGMRYKLVEVEKPEKENFLQLEALSKDKNFSRVMHVLLPDASKLAFKLGRGHDSDVKIGDISVSRVHAQITLTPKGYMLEDNMSKFGTLLLLPSSEPYEIDPNNSLSVQIGRSMITFALKSKDASKPSNAIAANVVEEEKIAPSPPELVNA